MKNDMGLGRGSIYLDCAILCPGDILLTADNTVVSMAIRKATGGSFSHAALIVERTCRLEADGYGTGYTMMYFERVEQLTNPRRGRFLHLLPSTTLQANVLRCPKLAGIDRTLLFKTLTTLTQPFLWKEYPQLCLTAEVFNKEVAKKTAFLPFLRVLDKYAKKVPANPGLFCSELVAAIFCSLGYPLADGIQPEEMSPNAIARSPNLTEVTEAITNPDESAELNDNIRDLNNAIMRLSFPRQVLPDLVEFKALVDGLQTREQAAPNT